MNTIPSRHLAMMTYALIAINCAVFLFQIGLSPRELEQFVYTFALIPARYFAPLPFGEADLTYPQPVRQQSGGGVEYLPALF